MTWNITPVATEVELTFAELGPALTRVAVEHRGWETLSDEQLAGTARCPAATPAAPSPGAGRTSSAAWPLRPNARPPPEEGRPPRGGRRRPAALR